MECRCALVALLAILGSIDQAESKRNGNWGVWSHWSGWATGLCAGNQRVRTRPCTNPLPSTDGEYCTGNNAENQLGPVHGGWSVWSQWSDCSQPCGGSRVNRTRLCNDPAPKYNGKHCSGGHIQYKLECLQSCPEGRTDGKWGIWGSWSPCPKNCLKGGGAKISRHRACAFPPPAHGGKDCVGPKVETIFSCFKTCPREGGFGAWSAWSTCDKKCGHGKKVRGRLCNKPEPSDGKNCTGSWTQSRVCMIQSCPGQVNGGWTTWSRWTRCSDSRFCLAGKRQRSRSCTNPAPSRGGRDCLGTEKEVVRCPTDRCTDFKPTPAPKVVIGKDDYIARECGVTEKFFAGGPFKKKVPAEVYKHLEFKKKNFMGGYFNLKTEESGAVIKFCFEPLPQITIREAANNITNYRKAQLLPEFSRPTDESQPILGFSIRINNDSTKSFKGIDFGISTADNYQAESGLKLYNVMFTFYKESAYFGFIAKGEYRKFKDAVFSASVYHNNTFNRPYFSGEVKKMKFYSFVGALAKKIPSWAVNAFKAIKLWDHEFSPVRIAYEIFNPFASPYSITATTRILGLEVHFEAMLIVAPGTFKIVFGLTFNGGSFGTFINKMSGLSVSAGGFLDAIGLDVKLAVAYCPEFFGSIFTTGHTDFQKEPLKSFATGGVSEGLTVVAMLSLPKDCKGSSFCKISKKILGEKVNFQIGATISTSKFKVTAGFYNIRLTEKIEFSKLQMHVEATYNDTTTTVEVGFLAEVTFPVKGEVIKDGIKLESQLSVGGMLTHVIGKPDITASLYMRGMWRKAFGVSWLAIGNIYLSLTIVIGGLPSGGSFGGQLEFGENCIYQADFGPDGKCLMVQVYFGVGSEAFFYGKITSLTVAKILRMAGSSATVPPPVAESGFPKGLLVQYNGKEDTVDLRIANGPVIAQGFYLLGTLNLLGYEIHAEIKYSKTEILIYGEVDPIIIGGFVKISRNASTTSVGPILRFHYRKKQTSVIPYLNIFFEGYAKVFGIEVYCFLNITMEAMEIYIYGKAWDLIYAELYVSAGYNLRNLKKAHFYVRVIVDLKGINRAIDKAKDAVNNAFKAAQKALRSAVDKVKNAKRKCIEKMKLKCSRCTDLKCKQAENNCKGFLDKAGKWIGGAINAAGKWIANTAKKIVRGLAKVGKAIKKFFSGWRRRRSLEERRNALFEEHIRNKRFISKLLCEGLVGGGCKGIAAFCYGACKAVEAIGKGLCHVLDVAVVALKAVEAVSGWIRAAINFLFELFRVYSVFFELGLGHKFKGGFMVAAEIDLAIFAQRMKLSFSFNLGDPIGSIFSAKDSGFTKYKKGVKQGRSGSIYDPYDKLNPYSDFDLASNFGIEATQTGDNLRLGGCIAIFNKNEGESVRLIGCNDTDTRQQWAFTLKGQLVNKYSGKCLDMGGGYRSPIKQRKCRTTSDNQKIECSVVARTLKRRRSGFCAETEKSSSKGPGSLYHLGSLTCINVVSSRLVLRKTCHTRSTEFQLMKDGRLRHSGTGYCVKPNGAATENVLLILSNNRNNCPKFTFTTEGSLQHLPSKLCVQTRSKKMKPGDANLVLGKACEKIPSQKATKLPSPQMLFSFVPTNNLVRLGFCRDDDYLDLTKRFEVMGDELATICSKNHKDLALRKKATQSSTAHRAYASRAVDGNYKFYWKDNSCTHTTEEYNPWWKVDLGKEYIVTDVTVINRAENHDRLKNFEVRVGNNRRHTLNPICHDRVRAAGAGEAVRLQCNPPIPGTYVSVHIVGKGILTVCEVIVKSRLGGLADWCLLDNGGCEQICINKCDRQSSCACYSGFTLAYDGKRCIDIDECLSNNGGCRADKGATCVNYAGSYFCSCKTGFILSDKSDKECVDLNECGVKNGGCEQMCNNTNGGYMCLCRIGYERKPKDPFGCQDINECKNNNGGCDHVCKNYEGGYYCLCKPGYRLRDDGKTCEEIYCRPLTQLPYQLITPKDVCINGFANIKIGQQCKFTCRTGYEMPGARVSNSISCTITGNWNKASPSCYPVKCPPLTIPKHGGVAPASCRTGVREYGQRCVHYCQHGYALRGPTTKYCQANKLWSSTSNVYCSKVYLPPYLNCPTDIVVKLSPTASTMVLKSLFSVPQTNMKIVDKLPSRVGPSYAFKAGITEVKYFAVSEDGKRKATCSHLVEIQDVTKPVIHNCPKDQIITTNRYNVIVRWQEPKITDNVGIKTIRRPFIKSGSIFKNGDKMNLQYYAKDTSRNVAICNFVVQIKSDKCPPIKGREGVRVSKFNENTYMVHCIASSEGSKSVERGLGDNAAVYCKKGEYWANARIDGKDQEIRIGLQAPRCVGVTKTTKTAPCPKGTVKRETEDWFGDISYVCENCPPGSNRTADAKECGLCDVGFFQDEEGSTECSQCDKWTTSVEKGASSRAECIELCKPGSFSPSGLDLSSGKCVACSKDSYSSEYGSKKCIPCPTGTTSTSGGNSSKQCTAPLKIKLESMQVVFEGDMSEIECMFTGSPTPKITWSRKEGKPMPKSFKQQTIRDVHLKETGSSLSFGPTTPAEEGSYTCTADNGVSRVAKDVQLVVLTLQ